MSIQLDLFEIAEMNARAELAAHNPNPEDLKLGDVVHVVWGNGVEFDGIITGLRGFWDGREEFKRWHWVLRYNRKHRGDKEPREDRDYSHFDPYLDEWVLIGRDEEYRNPDKSEILPRLIERIKDVPFPKRLSVFQEFEKGYPYLSYDFNPNWKVLSDAWNTAICTVTTIEEFLAAEKDWTCKLTIPKEAQEYIETVVFSAKPEERMDLITQMRWVESRYKDKFYMEYPDQKDYTYYGKLYRKFIMEARTPKQLVSVVRMRGGQSRFVDGKPPATFWIEEESYDYPTDTVCGSEAGGSAEKTS
ncbi:MAG: hypothetical protein K6T83_06725 [Alicyclobacillus sp.]|nr:hypothetical protein [Alicyclobacillus sp.]